MDMQTFGRELADVLAQRSLEVLRKADMSDVREAVTGRFLRPEGGTVTVGTAIGALVVGAAVGAGLTALLTPTTGAELRKRLAKTTRGARKQAMDLGESIASEVGHAGQALIERVESASTAIGLAAAKPKQRASGGRGANGQAKRAAKQAQA